MNDREQFRDEMTERLSVQMYNQLEKQEALDARHRQSHTKDYRLIEVRNAVKRRLPLPEGVDVVLRGYELIVENPSPVYIRFGNGNYWIGAHLFVIRSKEQIVDMICHTISCIIPVAVEMSKEQEMTWEKEYNKFIKLRSINEVARQISTNNKITLAYGN